MPRLNASNQSTTPVATMTVTQAFKLLREFTARSQVLFQSKSFQKLLKHNFYLSSSELPLREQESCFHFQQELADQWNQLKTLSSNSINQKNPKFAPLIDWITFWADDIEAFVNALPKKRPTASSSKKTSSLLSSTPKTDDQKLTELKKLKQWNAHLKTHFNLCESDTVDFSAIDSPLQEWQSFFQKFHTFEQQQLLNSDQPRPVEGLSDKIQSIIAELSFSKTNKRVFFHDPLQGIRFIATRKDDGSFETVFSNKLTIDFNGLPNHEKTAAFLLLACILDALSKEIKNIHISVHQLIHQHQLFQNTPALIGFFERLSNPDNTKAVLSTLGMTPKKIKQHFSAFCFEYYYFMPSRDFPFSDFNENLRSLNAAIHNGTMGNFYSVFSNFLTSTFFKPLQRFSFSLTSDSLPSSGWRKQKPNSVQLFDKRYVDHLLKLDLLSPFNDTFSTPFPKIPHLDPEFRFISQFSNTVSLNFGWIFFPKIYADKNKQQLLLFDKAIDVLCLKKEHTFVRNQSNTTKPVHWFERLPVDQQTILRNFSAQYAKTLSELEEFITGQTSTQSTFSFQANAFNFSAQASNGMNCDIVRFENDFYNQLAILTGTAHPALQERESQLKAVLLERYSLQIDHPVWSCSRLQQTALDLIRNKNKLQSFYQHPQDQTLSYFFQTLQNPLFSNFSESEQADFVNLLLIALPYWMNQVSGRNKLAKPKWITNPLGYSGFEQEIENSLQAHQMLKKIALKKDLIQWEQHYLINTFAHFHKLQERAYPPLTHSQKTIQCAEFDTFVRLSLSRTDPERNASISMDLPLISMSQPVANDKAEKKINKLYSQIAPFLYAMGEQLLHYFSEPMVADYRRITQYVLPEALCALGSRPAFMGALNEYNPDEPAHKMAMHFICQWTQRNDLHFSLENANHMVAMVKQQLKTEYGISDNGWKTLLQLSPKAHEAFSHYLKNTQSKIIQVPTYTTDANGKSPKENSFMLTATKDHSSPISDQASLLLQWAQWQQKYNWANDSAQILFNPTTLNLTAAGTLLLNRITPQKLTSIESVEHFLQETQAFELHRETLAKIFYQRYLVHQERAKKINSTMEPANIERTGRNTWSAEIELVRDWINAMGFGIWQALPATLSWNYLFTQQHDWHQMMQAGKLKGSKASWAHTLKAPHLYPESGVTFTEINTSAGLVQEGRDLHHCVASYSSVCRSGESRIFSVGVNGVKKSTLQLSVIQEGKPVSFGRLKPSIPFQLSIKQHRGNYNALVKDPAIQTALKSFLVDYPKLIVQQWEKANEVRKETLKKKKETTDAAPQPSEIEKLMQTAQKVRQRI